MRGFLFLLMEFYIAGFFLVPYVGVYPRRVNMCIYTILMIEYAGYEIEYTSSSDWSWYLV